MNQHEQRLARVFVELADTLVDDFDMLEFLNGLVEWCVELLDVTAAGVVLSDQKGGLAMAAASSEQARLVELFSVLAEVRSGRPRGGLPGGLCGADAAASDRDRIAEPAQHPARPG